MPVPCPASNDIAGTPGEQARIADDRLAYGYAVRSAFSQHFPARIPRLGAVVVRHHPQRDEDNTWQTWMTAICGSTHYGAAPHWADGAPLAGSQPTVFASIADTTIDTPVVYELWQRPARLVTD